MKIELELRTGATSSGVITKYDIQQNIDVIDRVVNGRALSSDFVLLMDTKSILRGIQNKLPEYR